MRGREIWLTYEAIYDIADAEEYVFYEFGEERADKYREDIRREILSYEGLYVGSTTNCYYRGYEIYKKPISPAIIFCVIRDDNSVHILRVTREEYDWEKFFRTHENHEYRYPDRPFNK